MHVNMLLPLNTRLPLGLYNRSNIENIKLSLSEILPVYLADRLYQSVVVSSDKYCIFHQVHRALDQLL